MCFRLEDIASTYYRDVQQLLHSVCDSHEPILHTAVGQDVIPLKPMSHRGVCKEKCPISVKKRIYCCKFMACWLVSPVCAFDFGSSGSHYCFLLPSRFQVHKFGSVRRSVVQRSCARSPRSDLLELFFVAVSELGLHRLLSTIQATASRRTNVKPMVEQYLKHIWGLAISSRGWCASRFDPRFEVDVSCARV